MKFSVGIALLSLALAGCMGPEGNPDHQPYADEPGGAMAVKPEVLGSVSYDPYGKVAPFQDMQAAQVAISPAPSPAMNLKPPPR